MKKCSWLYVILLLHFATTFAQQTVYYNNFNDMDNDVNQYTGNPEVNEFIVFSPWTTSANNFSTINGEGYQGTPNLSIDGSGTETIQFSIEIQEGFEMDIIGYEFWAKKTQGNSGWTLTINNIQEANGQTNQTGGVVNGDINDFVNATGTLNFSFEINGMGNGSYILDEFKILGEVRPICESELIDSHPVSQNLCEGDTISLNTQATSTIDTSYQWQISQNGEWSDLISDAIYEGVATETLTINNTPATFDTNSYRCKITVGYCNEFTTSANLIVYEIPQTESIIHQ
ncbi:MAG: hypothetical protein ACQESK_02705 [Bacteroidota bacterium]